MSRKKMFLLSKFLRLFCKYKEFRYLSKYTGILPQVINSLGVCA